LVLLEKRFIRWI